MRGTELQLGLQSGRKRVEPTMLSGFGWSVNNLPSPRCYHQLPKGNTTGDHRLPLVPIPPQCSAREGPGADPATRGSVLLLALCEMVLVSYCCCYKDHRFSVFKQHNCIISQFCRSEVPTGDHDKIKVSLGLNFSRKLSGVVSLPFPASGGRPHSLPPRFPSSVSKHQQRGESFSQGAPLSLLSPSSPCKGPRHQQVQWDPLSILKS